MEQAFQAHFPSEIADLVLGAKPNLPGRDFQLPVLRLARIGRWRDRLVEDVLDFVDRRSALRSVSKASSRSTNIFCAKAPQPL